MKKYLAIIGSLILISCILLITYDKIFLDEQEPESSENTGIKNTDEFPKYSKNDLKIIDNFYTAEILSTVKSPEEIPLNYKVEEAKEDDIYVSSNTGIYNEDVLKDFLDAYENSDYAFLRIITYTVEGDAIIKDIRLIKDKVQILTDTTRDDYGTREVTVYEYDKLSKDMLLQKIYG